MSLLAALTLALAGATAVGVAEGGLDLLREALPSERRRALSLLSYAVATWLVPFAAIVVPCALVTRGLARERLSSAACVAWGVGAWTCLAAWVDGRGLALALAAAIAVALLARAAFLAVEGLGTRRVTTLAIAVVSAAAVVVALIAHEPTPAMRPAQSARPPLIVLNIDTLRRDALSIHGARI